MTEENKWRALDETVVESFFDRARQNIHCRVACGGASCKHEDYTQHPNSTAIHGLNSNFVGPTVVASQRPSTCLFKQHGLIEQFHQKKISAVFNLQEKGEHAFCGPNGIFSDSGYSYNGERDLMRFGISYYEFPWPDMTAPENDIVFRSVQCMDSHIKQGEESAGATSAAAAASTSSTTTSAVLVHCHAGLGRTCLLIACYVIMKMHKSAKEAIVFVRSCRPGAIQTTRQVEFVESFEKFARALGYTFKRSPADPALDFQDYMKRQYDFLHGEDSRTYKYVPAHIHQILCRVIDLASSGGRNTATEALMAFSVANEPSPAVIDACRGEINRQRFRPEKCSNISLLVFLVMDWFRSMDSPFFPKKNVDSFLEKMRNPHSFLLGALAQANLVAQKNPNYSNNINNTSTNVNNTININVPPKPLSPSSLVTTPTKVYNDNKKKNDDPRTPPPTSIVVSSPSMTTKSVLVQQNENNNNNNNTNTNNSLPHSTQSSDQLHSNNNPTVAAATSATMINQHQQQEISPSSTITDVPIPSLSSPTKTQNKNQQQQQPQQQNKPQYHHYSRQQHSRSDSKDIVLASTTTTNTNRSSSQLFSSSFTSSQQAGSFHVASPNRRQSSQLLGLPWLLQEEVEKLPREIQHTAALVLSAIATLVAEASPMPALFDLAVQSTVDAFTLCLPPGSEATYSTAAKTECYSLNENSISSHKNRIIEKSGAIIIAQDSNYKKDEHHQTSSSSNGFSPSEKEQQQQQENSNQQQNVNNSEKNIETQKVVRKSLSLKHNDRILLYEAFSRWCSHVHTTYFDPTSSSPLLVSSSASANYNYPSSPGMSPSASPTGINTMNSFASIASSYGSSVIATGSSAVSAAAATATTTSPTTAANSSSGDLLAAVTVARTSSTRQQLQNRNVVTSLVAASETRMPHFQARVTHFTATKINNVVSSNIDTSSSCSVSNANNSNMNSRATSPSASEKNINTNNTTTPPQTKMNPTMFANSQQKENAANDNVVVVPVSTTTPTTTNSNSTPPSTTNLGGSQTPQASEKEEIVEVEEVS